MTEKVKKPAIRFKGFTDAWEQRELGDVAEELLAGGDIDKNLITENGCYPVIANALTNDGVVGYYQNSYRVKAPAVTVTGRGDVGHAQARKVNFTPVVRLLAIKSSHNVDFLENAINCGRVIIESTGVPQLTVPQLSKRVISLPQTILEEVQIGKLFSDLDNLITLHQRKCDKLVNVKKSLLEKMFPASDERVPKIRFKGFTETWEQREFSDLYKKVSEKNDLSYGVSKIISVANMYFKPDSYITEESYLLTYNVFLLGDIAFEGNKSKNYAHGRFVENTIGNGIVSHVFDVFRPKMEQYDLTFWKYAINNERLMGKVLVKCTKASTMMTNLVADDFLKEYFHVPAYEEQVMIGKVLASIDNLITLHQRKLEKLKNIKKSLLEKMFA